MKRMHCLKVALAAGVCLLPLRAQAQDDEFNVDDKPAAETQTPQPANYIDLGGQYKSSRSYFLGRYNGAVDPGVSPLGGLHYSKRDAWDSGGTNYFEVQGDNLGLDDRSFSAKIGQQGLWGLNFSYDGIPYYATNSFQTVYNRNGTLISGVAPGSLSAAYSQLLPKNGLLNSLWIPQATNRPSLINVPLSVQRDIFTGGGKYEIGDWLITAQWRHEHKEGSQLGSLEIGGAPSVTSAGTGATKPTGFTSGLAYFAQPIDYDTDRFDVTGAYTTDKLQTQVSYTYSQFRDNITRFDAQNPFNFFSPTLSTSYPGPVSGVHAVYALPPSNSAHQFKVQAGYSLSPDTRINANFGLGLQIQNAAYQSGIGTTGSNFQPLPRTNFDGEVKTYFANIALTSHPLPNFDLRLAYTMDDRENVSPQNQYLGYPTSTANTSFLYNNLPFSYAHQTGVLELGYRLGSQTKVTATETLDQTHRTYADTSNVASNRIGLKIRGPLMDNLFGTLGYAHEDRWAQNYDSAGWWKAACNSCNVEPSNFLMFFQASRKHDEIRGTLDAQPFEAVSTSMIARFSKDNYPSSALGLRSNYNLSVGPDVSWQVSNDITAHAYYTYQQIYYNQSSIYQSPGAPSIPAPTATNTQYSVPYNAKTTDSVHTFGANVDWAAIPNTLKLSLDYNFSYGDTAYALGEGMVAYGGAITSPTFGPSITMQQLPDVKSMLSVISLHGEYSITPAITVMFGYAWERFTYKDFLVGTSSTQYANALLPGTLAPNDSVHVVSAGMRFRF